MTASPVIAFVGMSHLGINSAAASASRGFVTICFDICSETICRLRGGDPIVVEPELKKVLLESKKNISFTDIPRDLYEADVIYISIDVPTDSEGNSELDIFNPLFKIIREHKNHLATVVILSQVPPGFCRPLNKSMPTLVYQVETLVFGQAVDRALNPERIIIGLGSAKNRLAKKFQFFLESFNCPLLVMDYESAELSKIAINCCLVSSISVANTLSEICENVGAVWSDIVPALQLDKRIGKFSYLKPGLGIAGGNLERDLNTVMRLGEAHSTDVKVVEAWMSNSKHRLNWVIAQLNRIFPKNLKEIKIAVWGLTYKENTHSLKNSPSIAVIKQLDCSNLVAFDPVITSQHQIDFKCKLANDPMEALNGAQCLMILTPWQCFKDINVFDVINAMPNQVVIDPYAIFDNNDFDKTAVSYCTLGLPHEDIKARQ